MKLENRFTVPVDVERTWAVLLDVERIAPCMPGATLTGREGDSFTGTVKVKVGPINLTYGGRASFVSQDAAAKVAVLEASGKETRGTGTAKATITCRLVESGASTEVAVETDLAVTGKPAQFGRGVLADISGKLVDQFAACLAEQISEQVADQGADAAGGGARGGEPADGAAPGPPASAAPAINLLSTAGAPIAKRLAPIAASLVVLALAVWRWRR